MVTVFALGAALKETGQDEWNAFATGCACGCGCYVVLQEARALIGSPGIGKWVVAP